jgi:hypothetical protein
MPQVIADLFEGQPIGDQSRRAGVAQCMRPTVGGLDSECNKSVIYNIIDAAAYNWTPRCVHPQKYLLMGGSRANRIDVARQGLGDRPDKWILLGQSPLQTEYPQDTSAPVYLVEAQGHDFTLRRP